MKLKNKVFNNNDRDQAQNTVVRTGGLPIRTDLRAGLAWDDLDDKAQELWGNLTSALSGLTGGTEASS